MSDGSSTEPAAVGTLGATALGRHDFAAAKPHPTITGYCADCGTWDTHGLVCSACGYDFGGAPETIRDA